MRSFCVDIQARRFAIVLAVIASAVSNVVPIHAQRLMVPGIDVPSAVESSLRQKLHRLGDAIAALGSEEGMALDLLPDVEIYYKAVSVALDYDEFIRESEFEVADELLEQGLKRAAWLREGRAPWTVREGLVVRGYRSRIDDSVQPYGLVVPAGYSTSKSIPRRTDVWLHGRDNRLTELKFINQRQKSPGQFVPDNTFVLHPYGRFCNAFKFAGEVDVFESLEAVKRHYAVDEQRVAIRGFSMGGAGCWHLAVHHPDVWVASAPGAGFAESAEYLGLWKKDPKPSWYQQQLWHCYDATDYALNLFNNPTVAYSGEIDKQIQAAEMMRQSLEREGMRLRHVIGPKTAHSYHPLAKKEVAERVDAIVRRGKDSVPRHVKFTTWTLRYPRSHWVALQGLERHWSRARVDAEILPGNEIRVDVENVTAFSMQFGAGDSPFAAGVVPVVRVNQSIVATDAVASDRSWSISLTRRGDRWGVAGGSPSQGLRKVPGLQGPIDDVFMDRFVIVQPTGGFPNTPAGRWIESEFNRLKREWRAQFRGTPLMVSADELTAEQIESCHLILWGDPSDYPFMTESVSELPVAWEGQSIRFGNERFPAAHVVPLFIYPNPLNPRRYVVLNSGFTFRGFGSNATQVPMLPDYALVDVRTPATSLEPGKVIEAGFFDEAWKPVRTN